jgi:hypothetical protein
LSERLLKQNEPNASADASAACFVKTGANVCQFGLAGRSSTPFPVKGSQESNSQSILDQLLTEPNAAACCFGMQGASRPNVIVRFELPKAASSFAITKYRLNPKRDEEDRSNH